ncbi:hypothetical protein [Hydrogenophaga sp. 2FB]|uniref:hypothetical protein n=1 Tax=Hydrogenophaga sp. 2FB TaxID=2502187 RepID=UPI0010F72BB9|nr:hypothetical protein [Hydrogenophaga sp. 2FB]
MDPRIEQAIAEDRTLPDLGQGRLHQALLTDIESLVPWHAPDWGKLNAARLHRLKDLIARKVPILKLSETIDTADLRANNIMAVRRLISWSTPKPLRVVGVDLVKAYVAEGYIDLSLQMFPELPSGPTSLLECAIKTNHPEISAALIDIGADISLVPLAGINIVGHGYLAAGDLLSYVEIDFGPDSEMTQQVRAAVMRRMIGRGIDSNPPPEGSIEAHTPRPRRRSI